MTKKQFRHAFLKGMGSALLELQSCDNPERYREIVLYGCLHDTTYDAQCEGDRGWYLYKAIKLIDDKKAFESAILQKYFRVNRDHWLFVQLTAILYQYAKDGSENASDVLYKKYADLLCFLSRKRKYEGICYQRDMFIWVCVWLTSLDGWGAFKRIIQEVSEKLLSKDGDYFFDEWFYDNAKGKFGKKRVEEFLQKQAQKSPFIFIYYEKAKAWDKHMFVDNRSIPTLEQVLAEVDGQEYHGRGLAMNFTQKANLEDLEGLAQAAINEQDIHRKTELLWGFRRRAFQFPESLVLEWSKSEDHDLRETAFYILGHNPSQQAHDYAISLIENEVDIRNGIFLLCKNYSVQDEEIVFKAIKNLQNNADQYDFHGAAMEVEEALTAVKQKPKTDILMYLYHQTPCSCCRYRIVQLMYKKNNLPDMVLHECQFDANSDIRDFAERTIKSRKIKVADSGSFNA